MPQLGAVAIIELVSALASAAGTGVSMYEGAQNRDAQKAQQAAALKAQQQQYMQQQGMAQTTQQMGTQDMIARLGQPPQSNFSGGWNPTQEPPYGPFQLSSFQTGG